MHWDSFVYTGAFCPDSLAQHALTSAYKQRHRFCTGRVVLTLMRMLNPFNAEPKPYELQPTKSKTTYIYRPAFFSIYPALHRQWFNAQSPLGHLGVLVRAHRDDSRHTGHFARGGIGFRKGAGRIRADRRRRRNSLPTPRHTEKHT